MLSTLLAWSTESATTPAVCMCIDPDWEPLERLTLEGEFIGIAADLLARIGGDEFVVLLPETSNPDEPARVMDKLAAAVAEPFMLNTITLNISASLGLAIYPDDGENTSELLQHADKAMYRHKAENRQNQKQAADPD